MADSKHKAAPAGPRRPHRPIREAQPHGPSVGDADVYVFSSDLGGRHSRDDALTALRNYGAVYGRAVGLQGRSYAIPVRDEQGKLLPIPVIARYVQAFLKFAGAHKQVSFYVTRIGCGREAYRDEQIAPLFAGAPPNCRLPRRWASEHPRRT